MTLRRVGLDRQREVIEKSRLRPSGFVIRRIEGITPPAEQRGFTVAWAPLLQGCHKNQQADPRAHDTILDRRAGLAVSQSGNGTMRNIRAISFATAMGCLALAASAGAQPSGIVIAVVQSSEADGDTGRRVLLAEAPVYSGDHIVTGPIGEAQVKFRDNTKLVIGPNSMMIIDAFVFENDDTARKISINAVRGAFRFITGKSPKDVYSVTTPTATIGVRG